MAAKSMHTNRRQALHFRCSGYFGRWLPSQCPSPAAVGDAFRCCLSRREPNTHQIGDASPEGSEAVQAIHVFHDGQPALLGESPIF
jgi:hypothetical protein